MGNDIKDFSRWLKSQALSSKIPLDSDALKNLSIDEGWAKDLVEMMYLEPETLEWAEAGLTTGEVVKDSNGVTLNSGDSVTIIKDLEVKGAGFTAKRGTVVKGISLGDDPTHIECNVNGVRIFLKPCFLKKS